MLLTILVLAMWLHPHLSILDFPILLEHLPCANILAYSLETVIAEKMHAIIDLEIKAVV